MKNQKLKQNDVSVVAAATNDIDDEKSIENNCQLHTGCGMENNDFFFLSAGRTCIEASVSISIPWHTMNSVYNSKTGAMVAPQMISYGQTSCFATAFIELGFFSFFLIWIYLNNYYFKQLCAYNSVNERVSAQQWPPPNRFGQWILLLDFAYFIALFGYFN